MSRIERWTAVVTNVDDPEKRGRIKVACAALLGADDDQDSDKPPELPDWVDPSFMWAGTMRPDGSKNPARAREGMFFLPRVGDTVEIEIEDEAEVEMEGRVRWLFSSYPDSDDIPTVFKDGIPINSDGYGRIRGFASANGIVFLFNDSNPHFAWTTLLLYNEVDNPDLAHADESPKTILFIGYLEEIGTDVIYVQQHTAGEQEETDNAIYMVQGYVGIFQGLNRVQMEDDEVEIEMNFQSGGGAEQDRVLMRTDALKVQFHDYSYAGSVGELLMDEGQVELSFDEGGQGSNKTSITIDKAGAPTGTAKRIQLGGGDNTVALGRVLQPMLNNVLAALLTHTHSGCLPGTPLQFSGPPDAATATALGLAQADVTPGPTGTAPIESDLVRCVKS